MKKTAAATLTLLLLVFCSSALAAKARSISTDAQSAYHAQHLLNHIAFTELTCTGNNVRIRTRPGGSQVVGHLEQADGFMLLDVADGFAQIEVTYSDPTSPDSRTGMTGWVSSDYIDCNCPQVLYESFERGVEGTPADLPDGAARDFTHSSGAGGWSTEMTLHADGSFSGYFHDSEMGITDDAYPYGTLYESTFTGHFGSIERIDAQTYVMTVESLDIKGNLDSETIRDGVRSIICEPAGLSVGNTLVLYLPDTPTAVMTDDQLSWFGYTPGKVIGQYYLYNLAQERGFIAY